MEAKLIPVELQESQNNKSKRGSKEAMLKEVCLQKLDCLCVNKVKGQDKMWPINFS